jgi:aldehyde:ferredoxin oxidoreductase
MYKMIKGYNGKILRVDLTNGTTSVEEPGEDFYRQYLGGSGFIGYYLTKELKGGEDPLGPDNRLIFATGPLTGVPLSGMGRNSVGAKSPLTHGIGNAEVGGFWGAELKHAGYDAIVVTGTAKSPVYLWIEDGKAEIKDASHLWGKTTKECEDTIKRELGSGVRVCQIGVAGEKMVRYACIVNDLNHAAGRSGLGAVMGSKKLRAIAVRGHNQVTFADPAMVTALIKRLSGEVKASRASAAFGQFGTSSVVMGQNVTGGLPTRNFLQGQFEGAEKIGGQVINQTILKKRGGCYACTIRCKPEVAVGEPYNVIPEYGGPEYEALAALGSNCGIDNLGAVAKANEVCTAFGLDVITAGDSIAFAMECFEHGILNEKDTDGIKLNFGNAEAMLQLLNMIIQRKGLGDILANDMATAAKKIGKGADTYSMHVKGQGIPMHEPRLKVGLGVGYAISPTGADHCHNSHDTGYVMAVPPALKNLGISKPIPAQELSPAKVRIMNYGTNWQHVNDCLVFCQFVPLTPDNIVDLLRAVTGWGTNIFELMKVAERFITMARVFNNRSGLSKSDDALPKRFFTAFETGPLKDKIMKESDFELALDTYYGMVGWDQNGVPTKATLEELGIGWLND